MIGLIFGETNFPKEILTKIKKKKLKYLIIDLSKTRKFKKDRNSYNVPIGQIGKIINILKQNRCKKVLFAGKVAKPNFLKLKLDLKGIYYIPRIIQSSKIGDASILIEIIKILKQEKINTVSSLTFNPELTLKKGTYSKVKPNNEDKKDIKKAISTLSKLGKYNFSQGTVVRNNKVVVIEDKSGTTRMLKKCKNSKYKNKGVLVKFPKKKQDLRIDLPTIGLKTLVQCKVAGLKGIVLKEKKHVFLERNRSINFANKNNIFLTVK
ncbi:MAG: UDP-2,3-diacylglucosamine diphosphatase LpxI [Candidatus Pelagibacter bacterium]|nr:UDP-2,3-diacylglucosamine diphosphatase LpxI [Candidatus Pelagibacter bacterium]